MPQSTPFKAVALLPIYVCRRAREFYQEIQSLRGSPRSSGWTEVPRHRRHLWNRLIVVFPGYAIAKRFLQEGAASVVTVSRNQRNIDAAFTSMHHDLGRKEIPFYFLVGDITDARFREKEIEQNQDLSELDILVNAAGISQSGPITTTSSDTIQAIINTNLGATIALSKIFVLQQLRRKLSVKPKSSGAEPTPEPTAAESEPARPDRQESIEQTINPKHSSGADVRPTPCIINISSLLGVKGGYAATAYAASKAGVLGFTRALVSEHGRMAKKIRVNAIVPGYIDTPMTQAFSPTLQTTLCKQIPLSRFGTSEEVADAAVFLAGNEYANNCVLNLDGGLSAT